MIDLSVTLERFDTPFRHYVGEGLIPPAGVTELNATLPDRGHYSREIKSGAQHRKEYRMWRCEPAVDSARTPLADQLPPAWSTMVDDVLSAPFRSWLSDSVNVDVTTCPMTAGLYALGDGDFTTTDTGKTEKLLTFALYLNEFWKPEYGGNYQLFTHKAPDAVPVREIEPIGGRCTTMTPSADTWHRIQAIDTGGTVDRMMMMLEFWRV